MSDRRAYAAGAAYYDLLSGELVYRAGRAAGVKLLDLQPGDTVLDVGCGTGLNFAHLVDAVGATGRVVGVDRSPDMLRVARRRIARRGWESVSVVQVDATEFTLADLGGRRVDAALSTYAMSVIDDAAAAWARIRAVLKPNGRVCIVDMQEPTGAARVLAPLARLACTMGGSDIDAHPWNLLATAAPAVQTRSLRGGHIQVVAGTVA